MRWTRAFIMFPLLSIAFALPACSRSQSQQPTDAGTGAEAGPTGSISPSASPAGSLGGKPIEAFKDGPWNLRRPAGIDGTATASGGPYRSAAGGGAPGGAAKARDVAPSAPAAMAPAATEAAQPRLQLAAAGPMKAGSTDDNAQFSDFLTFLAKWSDGTVPAGSVDRLDVADRKFVRVVDKAGNPVPGASVRVMSEDRAVWTGTTYGDGRTPFYAKVANDKLGARIEGTQGLQVEARYGALTKRVPSGAWQDEVVVTLEDLAPIDAAVKLDVLFVIDTTGSMGDEIERIKTTLLGVTEKLRGLKTDFDLQYGAVLYRDLTDQYVTSVHPFTSDIAGFDKALRTVGANGGGDMPESVNQALAEVVKLEWRTTAAKVAFLIGDAPPHMDYQGDVPYGTSLIGAVSKGIRIHSIAASGLDKAGTYVWRQTAQFTRGKFIFIEYGNVADTAASHGVAGPVKSNNLDDILFEQIRDELSGWGRRRP